MSKVLGQAVNIGMLPLFWTLAKTLVITMAYLDQLREGKAYGPSSVLMKSGGIRPGRKGNICNVFLFH